jgi:Tol biopolymer transport system component
MFSRDGQSLIVNGTAADLSGVFVTDLSGQTANTLIERDGAHWPVLSPDGKEVIFADVSLENKLFSWTGDGEPAEMVANNGPILARSLLWTDDNRLVFQGCAVWSGQGGECGTWASNASNIDPIRIVVGIDAWPMDARNGLLVYMSAEDGDWDIYLISLDGGQPENITANDSQDGLAAIAPDGKSVAYVSNESGTWALWTITLSNGEKQRWFDIDPQRGTIDVNAWYQERMSWTR